LSVLRADSVQQQWADNENNLELKQTEKCNKQNVH